MTENEAKEWIKYLGNQNLPYDRSPKSRKLACDIAIQALTEIQQYRAIGTVERFRFLQEVCDLTGDELEHIANSMIERKNYREIGTIEEFKALKEKEERFDRNIGMFNSIGLEIRAKVIDDFAERICNACSAKSTGLYSKNGFIADIMTLDGITETVAEIAEQMKAVRNE